MASTLATVEHPITKHCPILTAGDITPKAIVDLGDAHNEYFIAKEIEDTDKVKKILGGFKDVHIRDWIASDRVRLLALSYEDFMAELQTNYLPPDWEEEVQNQILGMRMEKNVKFWDWCQQMRAINIVLRGTESHLSDAQLRNQLEAALEPGLRLYCVHEKLRKIMVLKDWIAAVKEADEKLKADRKRSRISSWKNQHALQSVPLLLTTLGMRTRNRKRSPLVPLTPTRSVAQNSKMTNANFW